MAVELPTALPYFGAILAIAEVRGGVTADTALLLLYNVVFVAPLIVLIALARTASERGPRLVERFRELLLRHAPRVVPAGMGVIGAILIAIGAAET
jgi:cytochrome c biogenesis protein CcdA